MTGAWNLLKVFWRPPHKEDIPHYSKFFPLQITCWKRLRVLSLFESPWVFVIVCVWQRNKKCMQSERHTAGIPQLTVTSSPFCRECGRQLEMCESTFGLLCVCVCVWMYVCRKAVLFVYKRPWQNVYSLMPLDREFVSLNLRERDCQRALYK